MEVPSPIDDYGRLMSRWESGWARSRRLGPAQRVAGGLAVAISDMGRDIEYIALSVQETQHAQLARIAAESADAWLTVPTLDRTTTEKLLQDADMEVVGPEWLMRIDLTRHPTNATPSGYALDVITDNHVLIGEAVTVPDGIRAADARMAVTGRDAITDKVATEPAHRRRGLGATLMAALAERAVRSGADTGLLIAADEGRRLFEAMNWETVVPVTVAHSRVTSRT